MVAPADFADFADFFLCNTDSKTHLFQAEVGNALPWRRFISAALAHYKHALRETSGQDYLSKSIE